MCYKVQLIQTCLTPQQSRAFQTVLVNVFVSFKIHCLYKKQGTFIPVSLPAKLLAPGAFAIQTGKKTPTIKNNTIGGVVKL